MRHRTNATSSISQDLFIVYSIYLPLQYALNYLTCFSADFFYMLNTKHISQSLQKKALAAIGIR